MKKIEVIGHRGARAYALENTLVGYQAGLAQGVDWIDVDVVASKDKVLVGYHDLIINPDILCDQGGKFLANSKAELLQNISWQQVSQILIKNLTLAQLKQYQVKLNPKSSYSLWFPEQEQLPHVPIATLQEIVDYVNLVTNKQVKLQIEVKNDLDCPQLCYPPQELAELMYAFIARNDLIERVKVQAFDWRILAHLNQLDPKIKTAYLESYLFAANWQRWFADSVIMDSARKLGLSHSPSLLSVIQYLGGYSYEPEDNELTLDKLELAHSLGLKVVVWGWPEHSQSIFNPFLIKQLIKWQVDGMITDKPQELNQILHQLGYPLPTQFS
jgi:glycerophosphoryl diester phosphodiesterase